MRATVRTILLSGPSYNPITTAWIAAVVAAGGTVSKRQAGYVNTFVAAAQTHGYFSKFDFLYLHAGLDASQAQATIDLVSSRIAALIGAPALGATTGWTGDGVSTGVNLKYNALTQATNFSRNDAFAGCYTSSTRNVGAASYLMGSGLGTGATAITPWWTDDTLYFDVNDNSGAGNPLAHPSPTIKGLYLFRRTGASALTLDFNGSSAGTGTLASQALDGQNMVICGANGGSDNIHSPSNDPIGVSFAGGNNWTAQNSTDFYNDLVLGYLTSIGGV